MSCVLMSARPKGSFAVQNRFLLCRLMGQNALSQVVDDLFILRLRMCSALTMAYGEKGALVGSMLNRKAFTWSIVAWGCVIRIRASLFQSSP